MVDERGCKKCPRCGDNKPAEGNFYQVRRKTGDGFSGYCIACLKAKAVEWQKANPDKKKISDRKQLERPGVAAKKAATAKAWRKANPDRWRELHREWAKRNPEKVSAWARRWQKQNPEKLAAIFKRYHATEKGRAKLRRQGLAHRATFTYKIYDSNRRVRREYKLEGVFTLAEWLKVLEAFGGRCAYCGTGDAKMTIEHLTPLSRGGKHEVGNVAPACKSCNSRKKTRTVEEFAEIVGVDADEIRRKAALN